MSGSPGQPKEHTSRTATRAEQGRAGHQGRAGRAMAGQRRHSLTKASQEKPGQTREDKVTPRQPGRETRASLSTPTQEEAGLSIK